VNPRASRTVPFVAKATDSAIASIAARLMAGEKLSDFPRAEPTRPSMTTRPIIPGDPMTLADFRQPWFSVKEAVLPFARFPGVDTLLGPEMRSTGEVMGWDRTFPRAFLKAQLGAGTHLPEAGRGVHLDQGRRQGPDPAGDGADAHRPRPDASGHARHGGLPRRARDRVGRW
jgi:carbamoyl-phosphate synthase large subunit